jgi:hypothetical protein
MLGGAAIVMVRSLLGFASSSRHRARRRDRLQVPTVVPLY